jgi:hypothetical protein
MFAPIVVCPSGARQFFPPDRAASLPNGNLTFASTIPGALRATRSPRVFLCGSIKYTNPGVEMHPKVSPVILVPTLPPRCLIEAIDPSAPFS